MQYCPHGDYKYNTVSLEHSIFISSLQIFSVKMLLNTRGQIPLCDLLAISSGLRIVQGLESLEKHGIDDKLAVQFL